MFRIPLYFVFLLPHFHLSLAHQPPSQRFYHILTKSFPTYLKNTYSHQTDLDIGQRQWIKNLQVRESQEESVILWMKWQLLVSQKLKNAVKQLNQQLSSYKQSITLNMRDSYSHTEKMQDVTVEQSEYWKRISLLRGNVNNQLLKKDELQIIVTQSGIAQNIQNKGSIAVQPSLIPVSNNLVNAITIANSSQAIITQLDIYSHSFNIILLNSNNLVTLPSISFSTSSFLLLSSSFTTDNKIALSIQYLQTIDQPSITITLDSTTLIIPLTSTHLPYCISPFSQKSFNFQTATQIIIYCYTILFVLGALFCQKLIVIEMAWIVQYTFVSMIPIGIYCPPFSSLSFLKYSFGWNGFNFGLGSLFNVEEEKYVSIYYSALGIKSKFISNVNFMFFPFLLSCPVFYVVLTMLSKCVNHYRYKPRLIIYGKSFLNQIFLTTVLFNTPNVYVSFIVNLQTYTISQNIPSFVLAAISISLIILFCIFYIIFNRHYREYRTQFGARQMICKYSIESSTKARRCYPILIFLELTSISSLLALPSLFRYSLYLSLSILILISIAIVILTPYDKTIDNIRLLIHRCILLMISVLQIAFKELKDDKAEQGSFIYDYPWIVLIVVLFAGIFVYFPYLMLRIVRWVKSRGIIDIALYTEQCRVQEKPRYHLKGNVQNDKEEKKKENKNGSGKNSDKEKERRLRDKEKQEGIIYPAFEYSRYRVEEYQGDMYQKLSIDIRENMDAELVEEEVNVRDLDVEDQIQMLQIGKEFQEISEIKKVNEIDNDLL